MTHIQPSDRHRERRVVVARASPASMSGRVGPRHQYRDHQRARVAAPATAHREWPISYAQEGCPVEQRKDVTTITGVHTGLFTRVGEYGVTSSVTLPVTSHTRALIPVAVARYMAFSYARDVTSFYARAGRVPPCGHGSARVMEVLQQIGTFGNQGVGRVPSVHDYGLDR
jgi:hypothetical protein